MSSSIYLRAAASRLRAIGTNVWFMSYSKHWNSRRTWNLCFLFNFQLKKIRSKIIQITLIELWSFISFELRHLNSIKVPQKAIFGSSIFQLEIKRKQIFQVRRHFQHFQYDMNQTKVYRFWVKEGQIYPEIQAPIQVVRFLLHSWKVRKNETQSRFLDSEKCRKSRFFYQKLKWFK